MSTARLPPHVEVAGMIRAAQAAGGFATVLSKGERDAGTILILTIERGVNMRLWERMPRLDGSRAFEIVRIEEPGKADEFSAYVDRRVARDPDCWLLEVDVADAERFIAELGT